MWGCLRCLWVCAHTGVRGLCVSVCFFSSYALEGKAVESPSLVLHRGSGCMEITRHPEDWEQGGHRL